MSRQGVKKAAVYSTALIAFLVLLSPYILEQIINSSIVKHKISSIIQQKTGVEIDQDKIDFFFFPQPGVRLRKFEISFNQMLQLDIGVVNIDIDIFKLLKGKFAVSKILVETPHIRYTPASNLQNTTEQDSSGPAQPFHLKLPKQEIQELFALFSDSQDTLELKIINIQTDYFESMDGSLFVSNTDQTLALTAKIHGLNVSKNQFPENSPLQMIDINAIDSHEINVSAKLEEAGIFSGTLGVTNPRVLVKQIPETPLAADFLDLEFYFSEDYLSVRLKPVVFSYPHAKVGINFTNDKKKAKSAVTFTGDDIDIVQARQVCLKLMGSNQVVGQLFDILRGGTAKNVKVEFSSNTLATLFDGNNLFLTGSAENGLVKIPETPLIAEKIHGDAVLEKGILHIKAHKGQIYTTDIKEGWLDIDLMNHEDIPFKGDFNLHSDLSTLPQVLSSLLPDTLLSKELARVREVVGHADAFLKLGMESMQKELFVQVTAQNLSIKGFYDLIPLPITITNGIFFYEADKIVLKDFSGSLLGSSVQGLNASIDFSKSPNFDINADSARLNLDEMMPWLKSYDQVSKNMLPVKNINGNLIVDKIRLKGPVFEPEKWQFDIRGSGSDINIGFDRDQGKNDIKAGLGSFHLTDQMIKVQGVKAQIEDLSWLSYAIDKANLSSIGLPIEIFESSFETTKDNTLFQGKISFPSGPQLSFDMNGKNIQDLYPRFLILKDEKISDAMVMLNKDTSKPLINFDGDLNTQTLEKLLIKGSFLHNLLVSFTAGDPIKISTDPDSNIHLDTDKINLDSFMAKGNQGKKTKTQPLFDHKTLYLNTRQLSYKKMDFSNIDTQIDFNKDKTKIQIFNASLCDLSATGIVELTHDTKEKQVITEFTIKPLDKENIANMISCLFQKNNIIDGPYSFTCNLSGQASLDMISLKQNGFLTLNASNGRIYKWTFLSRLLSVLNILHFADITKEGIGYRTIVVEADIKDSVIHLKKAVIDADNMALIFSGWIDPLNDKMDITCLVAPFKTIDTIIKYIPVVNTMLSGRLVSFPAKATGSITDPDVIPLHPSAVGKGLVNMLGDILKTPVRLFEETP
ncbi:MAG: hypothetical protein GY860_13440 [Desulfobacteraceae bacterium]|nr:hypothetical protein [Desulfobacteraceae bacterium]